MLSPILKDNITIENLRNVLSFQVPIHIFSNRQYVYKSQSDTTILDKKTHNRELRADVAREITIPTKLKR